MWCNGSAVACKPEDSVEIPSRDKIIFHCSAIQAVQASFLVLVSDFDSSALRFSY